ncbi:roundabout homolog 2-like isoform X3 [Convolutriloba macropyga]|uniref:roundabout homolog 2-like isoform X3 n=1 Tax=Convolutriloba macropyga TaxID=536237 RepID=UPI003F5237EA
MSIARSFITNRQSGLFLTIILCGCFVSCTQGLTDDMMADFAPPVLIDEPKSQITLNKGDNYTMKCHARGEPAPRFTWYKEKTPVDLDFYGDKITIVHSGSSDSRLTFNGFDTTMEGIYYCKAENPLGSAKSIGTKVSIPFLDTRFGDMKTLVHVADLTQPELECVPPRGFPPPTISWQKGGKALPIDGVNMWTSENGAKLTIRKANVSTHQGLYTCVATNIVASRVSAPIKLVIEKPPMFIKLPPKQLTYNEGQNFSIPCEVVGANQLMWETDVKEAIADRDRVFENQEDDSLVVLFAKVAYSGEYTCTAKNDVGQAEATSRIIIQPAVDTNILVAPEPQTWYNGFTGTLDCRTKDQIITWTTPRTDRNEELVAGQFSSEGKYYVTSDGTLFVYDVHADDRGTYTCKNGISAADKSSARTAKIVVEQQLGNPAPLIQLGSSDQRIVPGGSIRLLCEGSSTEKVTISWSKDGHPFRASESSRYILEDSGTLIIKNAIESDSGDYTCTAKSPSGTTNQSSSLEVSAQNGITESYPVENLPGPPATAPYASFVNTTCVFLHWAPPVLNKHLIRYYRIEHYIYGLQSWTTVQSHIKNTESMICNLRPGRTYLFVARAMNDYGYGHASQISHEITLMDLFPELDESAIPTLSTLVQGRLDKSDVRVLEPVPISPTSLRVSWTVLRYPSLIKGFRLHFASSTHYLESSESDFVLITSPNERTHVLTNLQPWTTYNVSVQPFNGKYYGKKATWRLAFMPQVAPSAPPTSVEKTTDNEHGTVNISWSLPPTKSWNGPLLGYNLRVMTYKTDNPEILINQNVSARAYTVALNVSSFDNKDVQIQLAAFNKAGIGQYSEPQFVLRGENKSPIPGGNGGSSFDYSILLYVGLGLLTIVLVGAVVFLLLRSSCPSRKSGHGTRLRPVNCGDEKTYGNGSMGTYYYYFYTNPEELLSSPRSPRSNGMQNTEVDIDSLSPQSKLMTNNYFNMQYHMSPEMGLNPATLYKYHHNTNSPCSVVTSMSTPVHIEAPGSAAHHGGGPNHPNALLYNNPHHIPHSMTAAVLARNAAVSAGNGAVVSAAPDVIRVPSPPHGNQLNPGNPEYAEIPGGVYELAAPSSMSSDNCVECQRERAALAAAAALGQHTGGPVLNAQYQSHHNRQAQQPGMVGDTCLVSHSGVGMGGVSSGALTPATSTIMSMSSNLDNHSNVSGTPSGVVLPGFYGGIPHSAAMGGPGGAPNMHALRGAMMSGNQSGSSNSPMSAGGQPNNPVATMHPNAPAHFADHVNNNHNQQQQQQQMMGGGGGVCPPVANNTQYHQLANNDYTKLDESISGLTSSKTLRA